MSSCGAQMLLCAACVDDSPEQCPVDSQTELATGKESSLEPVTLSRSAITPTPNIVYLNDWFGSRISDIGDDRYGIYPRSEKGRRLWHKRQKREQRKAEDTATTRSEDVNEYKGQLSVEELLAYINSSKVTNGNLSAKTPSSTPSKKERNIRRKKKMAGDRSEDSDQASVSTMDTSSCSGYEAAEVESSEPTAVREEHGRLYKGVRDMDYESVVDDHEHFVVVQKKKKVRQPVSQLPQRYEINRRLPYDSFSSMQAVRSRPAPPVSTGPETCKVNDVVSLTSDTDSTSSYYRDGHSQTSAVRCSSPDFPDLVMQGCAMLGRRNSTGNVCENLNVNEKLPLPPSYAIVAAGGLRPNPTVDVEWRQSFVPSSVTGSHSQCEQLGVSSVSAEREYFCSGSLMLPEDSYDMPSRTHIDDDNSEPSTPTGYCSTDSHSIVSDDLAKELNAVKLQKAAERLQLDSTSAVPVSTCEYVGGLVDRKMMLGCEQRTKLPVSPVVFLDIANDHRPVRNNLAISFGFDGSDNICNVPQSECSSSESGFSDCTVHTDTDKISSVASTDSATSPIDPQDLVPTETVPSTVVQTVTVGHCRPIVPFLTTTGHQSCPHTPVGIVPPIPQVDRATEPTEQDATKDAKQDIMRSVINCGVQKDDILLREVVSTDKRFPHEKSLSSDTVSSGVSPGSSTTCSVPAGSFNLLTAQMFLYTGLNQQLNKFLLKHNFNNDGSRGKEVKGT